MSKFKKLTEKQFQKVGFKTHSFLGGFSRSGVRLSAKRLPADSSREALAKMKAVHGEPTITAASADQKVTWEYVFKSNRFPGRYLTVYDWKGWTSAGFGYPHGVEAKMTQEEADRFADELDDLLREVFTNLTDGYF